MITNILLFSIASSLMFIAISLDSIAKTLGDILQELKKVMKRKCCDYD